MIRQVLTNCREFSLHTILGETGICRIKKNYRISCKWIHTCCLFVYK